MTTQQLAESYEADTQVITNNFNRNKDRYQEGKHFICLTGEALREYRAKNQNDVLPNANKFYLWTEKGAFLHAKSLNTDMAWKVYDMLVNNYFKKKESVLIPQGKELLALAVIEAQKTISELQGDKQKLIEEVNVKNQVIGELKPKADYTDKILHNTGLVTITQIAKDYGMSAQEMNQKLHELGIQFKQSGQWLLYRQFHSMGYTHSETVDITRSDGKADVKMNTKWTQKGRLFLYNKLKGNGILPIIEKTEK